MAESSSTTQDFVPIREIRDDLIIMKDGSLRAILIVSSLNFGLKSTDEKEAIIMQYQNFLNSIDFDIQIFIQSRRLNIKPYLNTLESKTNSQTNELLKIQTKEYRDFIKYFTDTNDIMSKSFFVVVPYIPPILKINQGLLSRFIPNKGSQPETQANFEEDKTQLEQRISVVSDGLKRTGLRTEKLGTEELVEIFFKLFNPGETEVPTLANSKA